MGPWGRLSCVLFRLRNGWTLVVSAYTDDQGIVILVKLDIFTPVGNDIDSFCD